MGSSSSIRLFGQVGSFSQVDLSEPCGGLQAIELGGGQQTLNGGGTLAARSLPANSQFFLPTAIGRIAFATGLLSMGRSPVSAERTKAGQRRSR